MPFADQNTGHIAPVFTGFAKQLIRIQNELYLVLRASISYYMDSACQSILDDRIRGYENKRKLRDLARIDRHRRFTWSKIQRTIITLCCVGSTGGFFYLPLYTTIRHKGIFIIRWCNTISSIRQENIFSLYSLQTFKAGDTKFLARGWDRVTVTPLTRRG